MKPAHWLAIALLCAQAIDMSAATGEAEWTARAALLTPIAKAWPTDVGVEVASLGIQVLGLQQGEYLLSPFVHFRRHPGQPRDVTSELSITTSRSTNVAPSSSMSGRIPA